MIRAEHVREEMRNGKKVIEDPKATVEDRVNVCFKLITVLLKVVLSVRTNTKLIMDKVDAKPLPPRTRKDAPREEAKTETPKTEAESKDTE